MQEYNLIKYRTNIRTILLTAYIMYIRYIIISGTKPIEQNTQNTLAKHTKKKEIIVTRDNNKPREKKVLAAKQKVIVASAYAIRNTNRTVSDIQLITGPFLPVLIAKKTVSMRAEIKTKTKYLTNHASQ